MKLLDQYKEIRDQIFEYFGYEEDWCVFPLEDSREFFWRLEGEQSGDNVLFALTEEILESGEGDFYANEIYGQRFLKKWVYRGAEYTMVLVDTNTDGNKFLQIFDNSKERK